MPSPHGVGAEVIEASDLCLFSSVIGYMADPRHSLDELQVDIPDRYALWVDEPDDDADWAAGVLIVIKLLTMPPKHVQTLELRRELWANRLGYRAEVAKGVRDQVAMLAGCRYDIRDVRDVVAELRPGAADDRQLSATGFFVDLPDYNGGYAKLYSEAEQIIWTTGTQLATSDWNPKDTPALLATLTDSPALIVANLCHNDLDTPAGWTKLAAFPIKPAHNGRPSETDYVIANRDTRQRATTGRFDRNTKPHRPVWTDDDIITPDTHVAFVFVDRETCLYYRDLFVHRMDAVEGEMFGLMLLDGKVTTAFCLHRRELNVGHSSWLGQVFGTTITCQRYVYLAKLHGLLITSIDFRSFFLSTYIVDNVPIGLKTTTFSLHSRDRQAEGVEKLVHRERRPDGTFRLIHQTPWRDEHWDETLVRWLDVWGQPRRDRAADRPADQPKRERRQRPSRTEAATMSTLPEPGRRRRLWATTNARRSGICTSTRCGSRT